MSSDLDLFCGADGKDLLLKMSKELRAILSCVD